MALEHPEACEVVNKEIESAHDQDDLGSKYIREVNGCGDSR